jgi:hypothetical protein
MTRTRRADAPMPDIIVIFARHSRQAHDQGGPSGAARSEVIYEYHP